MNCCVNITRVPVINHYLLSFKVVGGLSPGNSTAVFANVSVDEKTPISRMRHQLSSSVLQLGFLQEDLQELLGNTDQDPKIIVLVKKMSTVIASQRSLLRALPAIEASRIELSLKKVSELVKILMNNYSAAKHQKIRIDSPPRLEIMINLDVLAQGLKCLLDNALQAVEGQENGLVTLRFAHDKSGTTISIIDNGPGIPLDRQSAIFGSAGSTKSGGSGLGVPLAAKVAALHGGSLVLNSVPGCTEFRLVVPPNAEALLSRRLVGQFASITDVIAILTEKSPLVPQLRFFQENFRLSGSFVYIVTEAPNDQLNIQINLASRFGSAESYESATERFAQLASSDMHDAVRLNQLAFDSRRREGEFEESRILVPLMLDKQQVLVVFLGQYQPFRERDFADFFSQRVEHIFRKFDERTGIGFRSLSSLLKKNVEEVLLTVIARLSARQFLEKSPDWIYLDVIALFKEQVFNSGQYNRAIFESAPKVPYWSFFNDKPVSIEIPISDLSNDGSVDIAQLPLLIGLSNSRSPELPKRNLINLFDVTSFIESKPYCDSESGIVVYFTGSSIKLLIPTGLMLRGDYLKFRFGESSPQSSLNNVKAIGPFLRLEPTQAEKTALVVTRLKNADIYPDTLKQYIDKYLETMSSSHISANSLEDIYLETRFILNLIKNWNNTNHQVTHCFHGNYPGLVLIMPEAEYLSGKVEEVIANESGGKTIATRKINLPNNYILVLHEVSVDKTSLNAAESVATRMAILSTQFLIDIRNLPK